MMRSEWRAAILGDRPEVGLVTDLPSKKVLVRLEHILCKSADACFRLEAEVMGSRVWTGEDMLSTGPFYVIGARGNILGCAAINIHDEPAYLYNVCVDHLHRGRGLGEKLMRRILQDYPRCKLKVWLKHPQFDRVLALYESLGFRTIPAAREEGYLTMVRHSDNTERFLAASRAA